MGGNDNRGNLDILAHHYGIRQKLQGDAWPSSLRSTFQHIQELSQTNFQTYTNCLSNSTNNEPWKRETRARVEWLAEQAGRLSLNACNENTWRDRIERAVVERFSLEPACPVCKRRLWRSEIESSFTGSSRVWVEQNRHRLNRGPCECPISDRPHNRYEIATSKLFDTCVDEAVIYDSSDDGLPKKRPDRVIGLRETENIRLLLDGPPHSQSNHSTRNVRDLVRCTPFVKRLDPLLFPFLVLEAKSDSSPASFSSIQTQTAFPIRLLLKLQRDLQSLGSSQEETPQPLVWFLGYRGRDWKVYGCYMGSEGRPACNIHYLQGGDITTKDGALQLLLIMDYIVDWARDTFRPSIIAQLRSVSTGIGFDEISLGTDSDILSRRGTSLEQFSRASSAVVLDDPKDAPKGGLTRAVFPDSQRHQELLYTERGAVRSVSPIEFRLTKLRVTEANVEDVLALRYGPLDNDLINPNHYSSRGARKLVNELTRWDEVLVVLGDDLDYIERVWTNQDQTMYDPFEEGPGAEFYTIFEYRCFMNDSWQIIREFSYFAVSKSAYNILLERAAYQKRHHELRTFSNTPRLCSAASIRETIECLHSGSAWQVFHSAVSSTLLKIYAEPLETWNGFTPPVEYLEFGYIHSLRVRGVVEDYIKLAEDPAPNMSKRDKGKGRVWKANTANQAFCRRTRRLIRALDDAHDAKICNRCRSGRQDPFALTYWDQTNFPSPTAYGAVLVASLREQEPERPCQPQYFYDFSLFVLEESSWAKDKVSVSVVVEDLMQNKMIYHTIRHGENLNVAGSKAVLWNLPLPYRKTISKQDFDIRCWIRELEGGLVQCSMPGPKSMPPWVYQQILLQYLRDGMSYDGALAALITFRDEARKLEHTSGTGHQEFRVGPVDCSSPRDFYVQYHADEYHADEYHADEYSNPACAPM